MTILATHFALVLGAWRLRIRIDIDEPRNDVNDDRSTGAQQTRYAPYTAPQQAATWGRG